MSPEERSSQEEFHSQKESLKKILKEAVTLARSKASGQREAAFNRLVMIATAFAETVAEAYRLPYTVEGHYESDEVEVEFGAWGCGRRTWTIRFYDDATVFMEDITLG